VAGTKDVTAIGPAASPPSRAESLGLSFRLAMAATPLEAKPLHIFEGERKARGFPHGRRQSRTAETENLRETHKEYGRSIVSA